MEIRNETEIKACSKCGSVNFGLWTSSSTGKISRYCKNCRDARRTTYNSRKKTNGGHHTRSQWLNLLSTLDHCPRCNRKWEDIPRRPDKRYRYVWTKDHILPLSRGGTDDISNIQPLCYQCNFQKNAGE
ncbi:TPA: HNH endonuclease signature motif containing protein [Klebsiella quasipneumoniae]